MSQYAILDNGKIGGEIVSEANLSSRDFPKTVGVAAGAALAINQCAGPRQTVRARYDLTHELNIIDAHAHPNMFYFSSQWMPLDDSSTIDQIKTKGLAASSFAAIGDLN